MEITSAAPEEIVIRDRLRRDLNRDTVERIKESIARIGLQTPLSVRYLGDEEGLLLVAGRHRLQACIEIGMARIPVREVDGSDIDARLWEIAENLHRAELTVTERSEHIAEWIRLAEKRDQEKPVQVAPVLLGGRGNKGGARAAEREIGIEHTEAVRAVKIDALPPEVKQEAKILHLDDNQSALLKATKAQALGKEAQIRALREHAVKRVTFADANASEKRIEKFQAAAKALSPEEFAIAAEWFDEYRSERGGGVFDNTSAGRRA